MKQLIILVYIICLSGFTVQAQQKAKIKKAAEEMAKATVNGDYKALAKYTHPKIVAMMGGQQKMIAVLTQGIGQMKAQGINFDEATIGQPEKITSIGTQLYAIVPQKVVMKGQGRKVAVSSSLLASSPDKGKTWYFTDAGAMTDAQMKQIFPDVAGKITIPKRTQPVDVN